MDAYLNICLGSFQWEKSPKNSLKDFC